MRGVTCTIWCVATSVHAAADWQCTNCAQNVCLYLATDLDAPAFKDEDAPNDVSNAQLFFEFIKVIVWNCMV